MRKNRIFFKLDRRITKKSVLILIRSRRYEFTTGRRDYKGTPSETGEDLSFYWRRIWMSFVRDADKIRKELCGNHVDLCSIINGRSGRCGEDCKFCAQSACHHTKVEEYPFLEPEEILEDCKRHEAKKVHRYSIVTAGRALTGAEMEKALRAYRAMKKECKGRALRLPRTSVTGRFQPSERGGRGTVSCQY